MLILDEEPSSSSKKRQPELKERPIFSVELVYADARSVEACLEDTWLNFIV